MTDRLLGMSRIGCSAYVTNLSFCCGTARFARELRAAPGRAEVALPVRQRIGLVSEAVHKSRIAAPAVPLIR